MSTEPIGKHQMPTSSDSTALAYPLVLSHEHWIFTLRLKSLKIPPADTRRAFMEDIVLSLTQDQQEWLAGEMSNGGSIKDYVRQLIIERYQNNQSRGNQNDP